MISAETSATAPMRSDHKNTKRKRKKSYPFDRMYAQNFDFSSYLPEIVVCYGRKLKLKFFQYMSILPSSVTYNCNFICN
jgi:hypothetical protein